MGTDPDGTERLYLAHEPPNLRRLTKDGQKVRMINLLDLSHQSPMLAPRSILTFSAAHS